MSYAFYPGCALSASALPYGMSFREVARALGMDIPELEDWNCCGATCFQTLDEVSAISLSGRNLALTERSGSQELVTPCSGCFAALEKANQHLAHDSLLRTQAAAALSEAGLSYGGSVRVRHLLDVMVKDVGLDAIKEKVTQPLTGLKVACYYGCLLTRPHAIARDAHPEYPVSMDRLMAVLGAEALDWSYKTQCCGASLALARPDMVTRLTTRILDNAREVGADVVVAACPLCQTNLDAYQGEHAVNGSQENKTIPIVYFTELMGLAFGLSPRALGFDKHFRDPAPALRSHSLVI
ncbi:MAG: CoB--CoM heterodisulfide reductase [Dehalococcoidia bacterium]|nr:CoB--CoM heterodisulfide reductase [Dehalococcoidia bacterium]